MQPASSGSLVPLSSLLPGESAVVRQYGGQAEIHYRLREMGLTRGVTVMVRRFAPLGDPIELSLRGFCLSLRKEDASTILVEKTAVSS